MLLYHYGCSIAFTNSDPSKRLTISNRYYYRRKKMKEDIARILKMVEDGKIELIQALSAAPVFEQAKKIDNSEKMLKIRVISGENDKVNVNLPIKFIKTVLSACGKIPISASGMEAIDVKLIAEAIDNGIEGKIIDVKSANGDLVEVFIE
jgi:hypothetical protein